MNGTVTPSQQTGTRLVDDFLRRELRVGDPTNPAEIAQALRRVYAADALRIDQEASGYAVSFTPDVFTPAALPAAPSSLETQTQLAVASLENDFEALIGQPGNRERQLELKGWRETVIAECSLGLDAARRGQDPAERDKTFYAIAKLSDFARVSRMAGVAYQELFYPYRRLAASLDAVGNVLRVHMGESLYRAGLAEGGLIVPMPLADARARRDGLVQSARRLTGVAPEEDDWPDGLVSYRALRAAIDTEQRADLLVYLREETLAPILDGLLAEASRLSPEALRELGAAALIDVVRLAELQVLIARNAIPASPPLASLIENIQLFLAFFGVGAAGPAQTRAGARLIELSVPVPLASLGAYVADAIPRQQLRALASWRHAFAAAADTLLPPPQPPGPGAQDLQIQMDQALYAVDRAIDHFARGSGLPPYVEEAELRAGAYLLVVNTLFALGIPELANLGAAFAAIFPAGPLRPVAPGSTWNQISNDIGLRTLTWLAMVRAVSPR